MANQDHGRTTRLGQPHQLRGTGPHLHDRAGPGLVHIGPQGLDGIDDHQIEGLTLQRRHDLAQRRGRGQRHIGLGQTHAAGARADLFDRLLTRQIGDLGPLQRRAAADLEQQGRLADAGVPADQQGRAGHQPTTADTVELADPSDQAGRFRAFRLQILELDAARALGGRGLEGSRRRTTDLFGQTVPLATGRALTGPFGMDGPADAADVLR